MRKNFKQMLVSSASAVIVILALAFFGASASAHENPPPSSDEVVIKFLHTNDVHAHINSHIVGYGADSAEVGGVARLVTFVKSARKSDKNVLFLSAGDTFQGTLFYNFFKGRLMFDCMNMARYDAAALGNHEFDDGPASLLEALKVPKFDVLNCNVQFGKSYSGIQNVIKPYVIKEIDGVKIAIIGIITKELFNLVSVDKLADIQVIDPVEALLPIVRELRPKVDMILLLSHMGLKEDLEMSEVVPDIDLIIGGHSHSLLISPVILQTSRGKQVVINQSFEKGEYVGEVNMSFSRSRKTWRLLSGRLNRLDKSVKQDPETQAIVEGYKKNLDREVKTVIGRAVKPLVGDKASIRVRETNLGNLISDAIQDYSKADIAVINGGGVRNSIGAGDITIESCINVFPFDNKVVKLTVKGVVIRAAFENVARKLLEGSYGGFLQVSKGMKVVYRDGKVAELSLNGNPINDNTLYTIAMSDFTSVGGDGHTAFSSVADRYTDGAKITDVIIEYVKKLNVVNLDAEGRIK